MSRRKSISPFNATIDEAIAQAERNLLWMRRNYPRMVMEQKLSSWASQHKMAVQELTIKVLKQTKARVQPELFTKSKTA